jgi:hypothetical protein
MVVQDAKLDFWIKNNLNVLFVGKHGVGKTSIIINSFERNKLKWKYYSAATMDPWVDFIGVPRELKDEKGQSYLDLVKPIEWAYDTIEALFFDEFSRSSKKIRNAVMELIQFKSINGKRFEKLKIIWAAINPDDEESLEYDVEKLDPAQEDRFHIKVDIPYEPDATYFKNKFGSDISCSSLEWWKGLDPKIKNTVSPRRLDYALTIFISGGDLRDVLPSQSNVSKLNSLLKSGSIVNRLNKILSEKDEQVKFNYFENQNNYDEAINFILKRMDYRPLLGYIGKERLSQNLTGSGSSDIVLKYCMDNITNDIFSSTIKEIIDSKKYPSLSKRISMKYPVQYQKIIKTNSSSPKIASVIGETGVKVKEGKTFLDLSSSYEWKQLNYKPSVFDKKSFIYSLYNNFPKITGYNEDLEIFNEIMKLIFHSNYPTLKSMYPKFHQLVQFLVNRICRTNKIKDEADIQLLIVADNEFSKFYQDVIRYNQRNKQHYSDFVKDDIIFYTPNVVVNTDNLQVTSFMVKVDKLKEESQEIATKSSNEENGDVNTSNSYKIELPTIPIEEVKKQ